MGKGLGPAVFLGLEVMSPARRSRWRNLINFLFRRPLHRQQSLEKIVPRCDKAISLIFCVSSISENKEKLVLMQKPVAIFLVTSSVVIIDLTKGILAVETRISFGDLNIKSICDVNVSKQEETGRWCRGRAWADTCQSQSLLFFVTQLTHRRVVIQEETKWQNRR